jgi:hypothetical protein
MNITIEIHYISNGTKILQSGSFQPRGRKPEYIALLFWKQIKKEMSYHVKIDKIVLNGDQDITRAVKNLEKEEWSITLNDNLPF